MSAAYQLSPRAAADLDEILEHYLVEAGVDVCENVAAEFERSFRLLANNPRIGHRRDDLVLDPGRFWAVFSYYVIYYPETQPLLVARVIHAKRDFASLTVEQRDPPLRQHSRGHIPPPPPLPHRLQPPALHQLPHHFFTVPRGTPLPTDLSDCRSAVLHHPP